MEVRGNGSIVPLEKDVPESKCRLWELRVSIGRDPGTGRYRQKTKRFRGPQRSARAELRRFIADIESGAVSTSGKSTFAEAAEEWVSRREDPSDVMHRSYGTTRRNRDHIRALNMHIGAARVSEIDHIMLESAYGRLRSGESPSGRELSGTYMNMIHQTANMVFAWLKKNGAIAVNPCDLVESPKRDTAERVVLDDEQIAAVVEALEPDTGTKTALLLDTMMGLRSCESCALDWSDVDFVGMTVSVRKSNDGREVRSRTKTSAGMRTLPLLPQAEEMLRRRLIVQEAVMDHVGPDTPICCGPDGRRTKPHSVTTHWRRVRGSMGMEGITPHQLRHSYLTSLYRRKVDLKILQKIAGHSRLSTTADIYVHVGVEDLRGAIEDVQPFS